MEHEVFVPVAVQTLRRVLADPARVARCVPGFTQDADATADPLSGRLKARVDGHTITYRGHLRVVEQEDGDYAVTGEGAEARGSGSVKVALTVRPAPAEGGTTLAFTGTSSAEGRLAELSTDAAASTAHRLLDRFAESLAEVASLGAADAGDGPADAGDGPVGEGGEAHENHRGESRDGQDDPDGREPRDEGGEEQQGSAGDPGAGAEAIAADEGFDDDVEQGKEDSPSVFDTPVPPPSLDPSPTFGAEPFADAEFTVPSGPPLPDPPPAEAAHARRTMIGRSAEEVDHAPPRGRYAPTPGPEGSSAADTLRWLAPAAALALASAVVVGRALRRRK
ncbi:SRPBCC domain-containing protein [Streptomyces sp. SP18CS02]|uniref:SRPBCC domain-containing protein n=1 Tax=Streptomyces sp. SP18CS02 TaxID=3002531 RepID=UPI002E765325|nr:SRPBCC domain-containing protein [Streptomyces sp. SP18CS02]MEE1753503.1 SRPBCC domain-containing protein [Streptomyces sp. SP18CS02]